jgi:hypothetical protein
VNEEETEKMLVTLFENQHIHEDRFYILERVLRQTLNDIKFLIPHLKEILENVDGVTAYTSENLSKRIASLEEELSHLTKKKSKYTIGEG